MNVAREVLHFWFEECSPRDWFRKDPRFDALVEARFGDLVEEALLGGHPQWSVSAVGRLGLILLLDQFPRGIYRGSPKAFAGDPRALKLSQLCLERGDLDQTASEAWRHFMLIPMMHSEDIAVQEASLPLFETYTNARVLDYAYRHRDIIARFGRYPHRNEALGRESTPEEIAFLQQPGSSF